MHKPFARALSLSGNQFTTALVPAGNIGPWEMPKTNRRATKATKTLAPVIAASVLIIPVRKVNRPQDNVAQPSTLRGPKRSASIPPGI